MKTEDMKNNMCRKPNILIVEDEPLIAMELSAILEDASHEVSATAYTGEQAINYLIKEPIDLVLLDITLDGVLTGIDVAHHIRKKYRLPFIFISSHSDVETIAAVQASYPAGFIVKPFDDNTVKTTVAIALHNHSHLLKRTMELPEDYINSKLFTPITPRELEVLQLLYNGESNDRVMKSLYISKNTLKTHIRNIFQKLDVKNRIELMSKVRTLLNS